MLVIVDSFRIFQSFKQNITIKTAHSQNSGADILTHYYSIQKYSQLINKNRTERTIKKKTRIQIHSRTSKFGICNSHDS